MKLTPYQNWLKNADTFVHGINASQSAMINKHLKKAYMEGVKQGRIQATELAMKSIKLRQMLEVAAKGLP